MTESPDWLVELLGEHRVWMGDHSAVCACGHELPLYDFNGEKYRAHVAAVIWAAILTRAANVEPWPDLDTPGEYSAEYKSGWRSGFFYRLDALGGDHE